MRYSLVFLLLAGCVAPTPYNDLEQSVLNDLRQQDQQALDIARLPPGRAPAYAAGTAGANLGRGLGQLLTGKEPVYVPAPPVRQTTYTQCHKTFNGFECWSN